MSENNMKSPWNRKEVLNALKLSAMLLTAVVLSAWMAVAGDNAPAHKTAPEGPRGTAIDGSEDAPVPAAAAKTTSGTLALAPNFNELDAVAPGLRMTAPPVNQIDLPENDEIKFIDHQGKTFTQVNFGLLSGYEYIAPTRDDMKPTDTTIPSAFRNQIPKKVADLNGKPTAIQGFMIPLQVEKGKVKNFVLVRNQLFCCFGAVPEMNEWIHVTAPQGVPIPYLMDIPIMVFGDFEVGEVVRRGQLISIYRMKAFEVDTETKVR